MPTYPTFFQWLRAQINRTDPVGEIARYAVKDRIFMKDANVLFVHLLRFEGMPKHRAQIKRAHKEWRKIRRLHRLEAKHQLLKQEPESEVA